MEKSLRFKFLKFRIFEIFTFHPWWTATDKFFNGMAQMGYVRRKLDFLVRDIVRPKPANSTYYWDNLDYWNLACCKNISHTFQRTNKKGADQTVHMDSLVCPFVVCIQECQVFMWFSERHCGRGYLHCFYTDCSCPGRASSRHRWDDYPEPYWPECNRFSASGRSVDTSGKSVHNQSLSHIQ